MPLGSGDFWPPDEIPKYSNPVEGGPRVTGSSMGYDFITAPHRTRDGLLFYPWLDRIEKEGWVMVNLFPQEMNGAGARMPFCAWMAAND